MYSDEYRQSVYRRLQLWETEDLLDVLRTRDEEKWTPEALEVVERIVKERLGEVPSFEEDDEALVVEEDTLGDSPVFYDREEAMRLLSLWFRARKWLIWAILAINFWVVWTWHRPYANTQALVVWGVDLLIMLIGVILEVFVLWWVMGVLASILKALLRIEEQTRPPEETET